MIGISSQMGKQSLTKQTLQGLFDAASQGGRGHGARLGVAIQCGLGRSEIGEKRKDTIQSPLTSAALAASMSTLDMGLSRRSKLLLLTRGEEAEVEGREADERMERSNRDATDC